MTPKGAGLWRWHSRVSFLSRLYMALAHLGIIRDDDPDAVKSDKLEALMTDRDPVLLDALKLVTDDFTEMTWSLANDHTHAIWFRDCWWSDQEYKAFLLGVATSKYVEKHTRDTACKRYAPCPGFVYLLSCEEGYFKIGRTNNPERRLDELHTLPPFKFELEHTIPADDMKAAEKELHQRFAEKRVNGEWFRLGVEDVSFIKALTEYTMGKFTPDAPATVII
jgi:hypothetical protein